MKWLSEARREATDFRRKKSIISSSSIFFTLTVWNLRGKADPAHAPFATPLAILTGSVPLSRTSSGLAHTSFPHVRGSPNQHLVETRKLALYIRCTNFPVFYETQLSEAIISTKWRNSVYHFDSTLSTMESSSNIENYCQLSKEPSEIKKNTCSSAHRTAWHMLSGGWWMKPTSKLILPAL